MTNREFFQLVLDATRDSDAADYQAMYAFASEAIGKLDAKNANRKPSKESVEAQARRTSILDVFNPTEILDRDTVAERAGCTPGQATSALTFNVKAGLLVRHEAKGKGGKTTYSLAIE